MVRKGEAMMKGRVVRMVYLEYKVEVEVNGIWSGNGKKEPRELELEGNW